MSQDGRNVIRSLNKRRIGLRSFLLATLTLVCASLPIAGKAVELRAFPSGKPGDWIIYLSGTIEDGDARLLTSALEKLPRLRSGQIRLKSPGGNVLEAMKMGNYIRLRELRTFTMSGDGSVSCASACLLVFMGGVDRIVDDGAIGIHRPTYSDFTLQSADEYQLRNNYDSMLLSVRLYLENMGAGPEVFSTMMRIPSGQLLPLSVQLAQQWNVEGRDPLWDERRRVLGLPTN